MPTDTTSPFSIGPLMTRKKSSDSTTSGLTALCQTSPTLPIKSFGADVIGLKAQRNIAFGNKLCALCAEIQPAFGLCKGISVPLRFKIRKSALFRNQSLRRLLGVILGSIGFDYALYLRSIGIDHIFEARSIELCTRENISIPEGIGSVVQMTLYELREEFIALVEECAGEETAGMIRAIMFGSKTGIDEEVLEAFRKNGTAHVLAVSGLHVGLLYAFFSFVCVSIHKY